MPEITLVITRTQVSSPWPALLPPGSWLGQCEDTLDNACGTRAGSCSPAFTVEDPRPPLPLAQHPGTYPLKDFRDTRAQTKPDSLRIKPMTLASSILDPTHSFPAEHCNTLVRQKDAQAMWQHPGFSTGEKALCILLTSPAQQWQKTLTTLPNGLYASQKYSEKKKTKHFMFQNELQKSKIVI